MELSLFRDICIIGNNKAINLILVIGTGFQVEAHTEDALGSVYACTVCNDSLTVTDDHALIICHIDVVGAGLNLFSDRLTLVEIQRKQHRHRSHSGSSCG